MIAPTCQDCVDAVARVTVMVAAVVELELNPASTYTRINIPKSIIWLHYTIYSRR